MSRTRAEQKRDRSRVPSRLPESLPSRTPPSRAERLRQFREPLDPFRRHPAARFPSPRSVRPVFPRSAATEQAAAPSGGSSHD